MPDYASLVPGFERLWTTMKDELAALSSDHVHVVALRSDHFVQRLDGQPGVVIRATDAVVNTACATHASPGAGTCSPARASFADEYP